MDSDFKTPFYNVSSGSSSNNILTINGDSEPRTTTKRDAEDNNRSNSTDQRVINYISNELKTDSVVRLSHINLRKLPLEAVDLMIANNTDKLYMQKNRLLDLPQNFSKLEGLRLLDLKDNEFQKFPSQSLPLSIEILDISNNSMTSLQKDLWTYLPNLKYLNLKNNKFESINELEPLLKLNKLRILEIDEFDDDIKTSCFKDLSNLKKFGSDVDPLLALKKYFESLQTSTSDRSAKGVLKRTGSASNIFVKEDKVLNQKQHQQQQNSDTYLYNHSKYNDYFKRLSILPEDVNEDFADRTPKMNRLKSFPVPSHLDDSFVEEANEDEDEGEEEEEEDGTAKNLLANNSNAGTERQKKHSLKNQSSNSLFFSNATTTAQQGNGITPSFTKWSNTRNSRIRSPLRRGQDLYRVGVPPLKSLSTAQDSPQQKEEIQKPSKEPSRRHHGLPDSVSTPSFEDRPHKKDNHTKLGLNSVSESKKNTATNTNGQRLKTSKEETTNDHSKKSKKKMRQLQSNLVEEELPKSLSKTAVQQIKAIRYDRLLICCRKLLFIFTECQQTIRRITSFGKDKTVAMNVVSLLYGVTSHIDNLVEVLEKVESNRDPINNSILIQSCTAIIPSFKQIFKLISLNFDSFFDGNEICFLRMFYVTIMCSYTEMYNAWSLIKQDSEEAAVLRKDSVYSQRPSVQRQASVAKPKSASLQTTFSNIGPIPESVITSPTANTNFHSQLQKKLLSQTEKPVRPRRTSSLSETPAHTNGSTRYRSSTMVSSVANGPPISSKVVSSKAEKQRLAMKSVGHDESLSASTVSRSNSFKAPSLLHKDMSAPSLLQKESTEALARPSVGSSQKSSVNILKQSSVLSPTIPENSQPTISSKHGVNPSENSVSHVTAKMHEIDLKLYRVLHSVVSMASVATSQLNSNTSKMAIKHAQNVYNKDESSKTSEMLAPKIKSLMATCVHCLELSKHMDARLAVLLNDESALLVPAEKRKTWELINAFLKSIISLLACAKSVINNLDNVDDLRPNLGILAKTTKEVTLILDNSSYKNASLIKVEPPAIRRVGSFSSKPVNASISNLKLQDEQSKYTSAFPADLKTTPSVASALAPAMNYFEQQQ